MITALGLIAGTISTLSFVPQVVKAWRTKHTKDLSLPMYTLFSLAIFLWMVYGYLTQDIPVFVTNIIVLSLSISILIAKIRYG